MDDLPTVHNRIKDCIRRYVKRHGFTMREVSERAGLNPGYITCAVNRETPMSIKGIRALHKEVKFPKALIRAAESAEVTRTRVVRGRPVRRRVRMRTSPQPWTQTVSKMKRNPHISAGAW